MVEWKAPGIAHASQVVQKYTLIATICLSRLNTEILKKRFYLLSYFTNNPLILQAKVQFD